MKKLIFYLLFFMLNISAAAQQDRNESWNMMLHIEGDYSLTTSDWEYTHPYILGSGSFTGRISGTYEESYGFAGGIELSKGYLGGQISVGIFPAKFSIKEQVDPGITQTRNDAYTYNSIFLEAEGILFPLGSPVEKISPFIKVGLGGMITSGDIKNNLLLLSGSGGTRIFISKNLGLDLSINFRHMWLYNVNLTDQISAAYGVSLSALSANVGILFKL
jgi:hypothetical protein